MRVPLDLLRQCRFLTGPTASGKSAVAMVLAQQIDAEILALDSMTLYRGFDIGTAKPSKADQISVRHHLIDLLDPDEDFTVADYLRSAIATVEDVLARDKTPLFVGGSGMYLRAVLRGVFDGPGASPRVREELEIRVRSEGLDKLHTELAAIDPESASRIHPNDARRIVRALEVWQTTQKPISSQQHQSPLDEHHRPAQIDWISPPRDWLYERINQRTLAMIGAGWPDEVKCLAQQFPTWSRSASQALGYKELRDTGGVPSQETIVRIQTRTRQFAKRQETWFRNLEECSPVVIKGHESPEQIAAQLM